MTGTFGYVGRLLDSPHVKTANSTAMFLVAAAFVVSACTTGTDTPTSTAPILSTTTSSSTTTSQPGSSTTAPTTTTPSTTTTTLPLDDLQLTAVEVASGLDAPVLLIADPAGGPDLVVEQPGRVVRLDDGRHAVLDIREDVAYGGEQGLLGLAFHPAFGDNQLAYVNYTGRGGQTVIEQFRVDASGDFDLASRLVLLEIPQPAGNHNGGMIAFGPDGHLWIGTGDGGGADDRFGQGQRADTLLGAMLRIAVGVEGVPTYAIPPDNPYADGDGGAPEVWAIGLRNPWRFTFDAGTVWIADVGQNRIEEISASPTTAGALNYGWPIMEGSDCFAASACVTDGLVLPVAEYDHGQGCSITGGHVYRGDAIPELRGQYLFSDFCSGFIRSFSPDTGEFDWTPGTGTIASVSGFGVGGDGEMYVVSLRGTVHRLERAA